MVSVPVFLLNLGQVPFIEDEGIRSLVALEMDLSGNYIAPSLNAHPYFKKPPLWNWIILGSYKLFGVESEYAARFPTILCLYGFCLSIFFFVKRHLNVKIGCIAALLFLTCGRVLFWDSMLALIDIGFSWVIFIMLAWIYEHLQKEQYLKLYLGAYFLCGIAFLLKALPALVFLGLTLLVVQVYNGSWRRLFAWQHFAGILTMLALLSCYLYLYTQHQPLSNLMSVFLDESTQRTFIEYGLLSTIKQIFTFPFEMVYHFLPWSLLCLLLFRKDILGEIKKQPLVVFSALIFAANIWIYWISPEVYPRYLFALAPFYFIVGGYLYESSEDNWRRKWVNRLFLAIAITVCLGSAMVFFIEQTKDMNGLTWRWGIAAMGMIVAIVMMMSGQRLRLFWFCVFLLSTRMGFDLIVLPTRGMQGSGVATRDDAIRIAQRTMDHDLAIYQSDSMRYEASFYLSRERKRVVPIVEKLPTEGYLMINPHYYSTLNVKYPVIDTLRVRRSQKYVYLIDMEEK